MTLFSGRGRLHASDSQLRDETCLLLITTPALSQHRGSLPTALIHRPRWMDDLFQSKGAGDAAVRVNGKLGGRWLWLMWKEMKETVAVLPQLWRHMTFPGRLSIRSCTSSRLNLNRCWDMAYLFQIWLFAPPGHGRVLGEAGCGRQISSWYTSSSRTWKWKWKISNGLLNVLMVCWMYCYFCSILILLGENPVSPILVFLPCFCVNCIIICCFIRFQKIFRPFGLMKPWQIPISKCQKCVFVSLEWGFLSGPEQLTLWRLIVLTDGDDEYTLQTKLWVNPESLWGQSEPLRALLGFFAGVKIRKEFKFWFYKTENKSNFPKTRIQRMVMFCLLRQTGKTGINLAKFVWLNSDYFIFLQQNTGWKLAKLLTAH